MEGYESMTVLVFVIVHVLTPTSQDRSTPPNHSTSGTMTCYSPTRVPAQ